MSIRNAVLTACMAAAVASTLSAGPRPTSPRPTITFFTPADSAPPVVLGDGIAASTYTDGLDGVAVTLQSIGDIQLDTRSSTTRGLALDFGAHLDKNLQALPGNQTIVKRVLMTSHCYNTPGATPLNKMTYVGQPSVCSMTLRYDNDANTPNTYYRLGFNTEKRNTEYVSFNCDALTGGFCSQWTATPADNNNPGSPDFRSNAAVVPVTESKRDGQVEGANLADAVPFNFHFTFRK